MRRSFLRCGVLPAAAALAVLTGCTSDEPDITGSEETTAAETTAGSETETETETEAAADEEFCAAASTVQERITASATAGNPAELPQIFRDAAEEIRAIEAPDELAPDWNALADGVEQFATTLQDVDLTDPQALATLEEELAPLEQELNAASANVQTYLAEECGVGGSTEEAAPSS